MLLWKSFKNSSSVFLVGMQILIVMAAEILKFKLSKEYVNNNTWSSYNEAAIFSGHMIDF